LTSEFPGAGIMGDPRAFHPNLETVETMEDVALNMRAPYFYPARFDEGGQGKTFSLL
jgi:hypothetical protein